MYYNSAEGDVIIAKRVNICGAGRHIIGKAITLLLASMIPISCGIFLAEPTNAASAGITIKDMEDQIGSIEDKIKIYEENISKNESEIESQLVYKENLDRKLSLLMQKVDITNDLIAQYDSAIEDKNVTIIEKENEIDANFEEFCDLLRILQEYNSANYISIILSADNFTDFLADADRISHIIGYQTDIMNDLQQDVDALEKEKSILEDYKNAQISVRASLTEDEAECTALQKEADEIISSLQKDNAQWEKTIEQTERSRDELNARLEEELKKLASEDSIYVGGSMCWPTAAEWNKVSSPFGWRTVPWPGFHTGIDIPAPSGTPIYAANTGTVITAEWHSSYGYYIIVSHGGGYSTLYAHCSRLYVKKGDYVQKGQTIAGIGTTGTSTGNHLHFETRVNGKAVDPLGYVTAP